MTELIVRGVFCLFVFWLPLESPNRSFAFDTTTLLGFVFLATTLLAPRLCYRRVPGALWWFFAYLYACALAFAFGPGDHGLEVRNYLLRIGQLVMIFWAGSNLMRDERTARVALLSFVVSCTALAIMQLTGIGSAPVELEGGLRRASVLGQNPNRTARLLGGAILMVVGLSYGRPRPVFRPRLLVWPLAAMMLMAVIKTGSRGGLLALFAGLWMFAFAGTTLSAKVKNALLTLIAVVVVGALTMQSPLMRKRLEMAESGNLAKREDIFPAALQLFVEKPLMGWGVVENQYELALRLPQHGVESRDTHNLVLEVTTTTGLLGAIPFLIGLATCAVYAWRARTGPSGILPLAMFAAACVGNMSGNLLAFKTYWVMLAFATASAALSGPIRARASVPIASPHGRLARAHSHADAHPGHPPRPRSAN